MFWNIGFGAQYNFAPKLKKHYVRMILSAVTGLLVVGILAVFFYKTAKMDIAGSSVAAVVCAGILALLIAGAIYAGRLFG